MISAGNGELAVSTNYTLCQILAQQGISTLLRVKPASLLSIDKSLFPDLQELSLSLRDYLRVYSCAYLPFQETAARIYLFLYGEDLLYPSLSMGFRASFLEQYGYGPMEPLTAWLELLGRRYRGYWMAGEFPHELGLFLGYPLADVEGFIHNHGRNYLLCGLWKVYSRVPVAEAAFSAYHQLRSRAVRLAETKGELLCLEREEADWYQRIFWELLAY